MAKYSEEARRLWPYLLPFVERVSGIGNTGGGSSGSAGVGGAPSPHSLDGAHHTGTITNAQGPQFLLTDGTRTLTGNLAVTGGITIDGVDLSAHVLDPNAHHDAATSGNAAIGLSGQIISAVVASSGGLLIGGAGLAIDLDTTPGLVLGAGGIKVLLNPSGSGMELTSGLALSTAVAGNGLAMDGTTRIMSVNVGDGIEVASDLVAVDLATNSGLTFSGGDLTMGAPSNTTVSSTNSVTTTTHTHAVSTNSNVGLYGTVGATILASTAGGGLTLSNLDVTGSVDITDGGDLTVGANILFVDASQDSVGIMRAPDPQFALDVNGPIRGTEIVGRHALQLEDVALLLHFDGGHPYESNFTGEPNGIPLGQVPGANQNIHYRPGKFYKAAVMGTTRTNHVGNPSFETNTTGWAVNNAGSGDLAVSRLPEAAFVGSYGARLTWTTIDTSFLYYSNAPASSLATDYTFSVWMRTPSAPLTVLVRIMRSDAPFDVFSSESVTVTNDWQRFSTKWSAIAGVPLRVSVWPQGAASTVYVDGAQMENFGNATWYIDGSLGDGYDWAGTAHASTSTRTNGYLAYSLTAMLNHRWSMMAWVCWPYARALSDSGVFGILLNSGHTVDVYANTSGISAKVYDGSTSFPPLIVGDVVPGQWYHIAVTYASGTLLFYVDGTLVATSSIGLLGVPTQANIGVLGGPYYADVMIDDYVVVRRTLSADRVKAIVESDAPVFAESSVFSFRATAKGLVWADEEGLWMRNVAGGEVLGAYGGETTKSWAGMTLSPSDFVLGDSNRGAYMLWDDSAGSITIGKTGASTGNLYLDGSSVKLRHNTVERFSLSSAGALVMKDGAGTERFAVSDAGLMTIKDSGGGAVFSFDASAGAEFTKPLTLGTNGGIYQGTGTFSSPDTGLKIFNQSGKGIISGYNNFALQWGADTDGKLKAGGGNIILDAGGVRIIVGSAPLGPGDDMITPNALKFVTSAGVNVGRVYGAGTGHMSLAAAPSTGAAELYLMADALDSVWGGGATGPYIRLETGAGALTGSQLSLDANTIVIGHNVTANADIIFKGDVTLEDGLSTTAIVASGLLTGSSLKLTGDPGGNAGFITLGGNSNVAANSSGVGTVKMKGTTSRDSGGFLKFYYGTTPIWIPFFYDITG